MANFMNEFNSLYESAPVVCSKWGKELKAINEAFDGKLDYVKQVSTALLLENTQNHITRMNQITGMNEATQPADVAFFQKHAINLLSAVSMA